VAAPWFIAGAIRQGMPFVDTVFLHGSLGVGRFVRPFLTSPIPYWQVVLAYVPMLAAGLLPWTGLLPGAVREGWRGLRAGPPPIRLCALWAGVYFLLVSLAPGDKVWRYLYPCYPPLAVLAARWLTGAIGDARRLRGAAGILLVVSVPDEHSERLLWRFSPRYRTTPGGHVRLYRRGDIARLLRESGAEPYATDFRHSLESVRWLVHSVVDREWGKPGAITRGIRWLLDTPSHRNWRALAWCDALGNRVLPKSIVLYGRKLEGQPR